jgi:hypothetical protein
MAAKITEIAKKAGGQTAKYTEYTKHPGTVGNGDWVGRIQGSCKATPPS